MKCFALFAISLLLLFLPILAQDPTTPPPTDAPSSTTPDSKESSEEDDDGVELIETTSFDPKTCTIEPPPTLHELEQYYNWMDAHGKRWKDAKQRMCKMVRVIYNARNIRQHNENFKKGLETFKRALWDGSDLTLEEKKEKYLMKNVKNFKWRSMPVASINALPAARPAVNYTAEGLVSPATDQLWCGSCYAFAAVNALEGQIRKCGISQEPLSQQAIVDCATVGVWGCSSGWPYWSYRWMMSTGVIKASDYPYTGEQGTCQYNASNIIAYVDDAFTYDQTNATIMKQAVSAIGPLAVVLCVEDSLFSYSSGIYKHKACCTQVMHAVTVTGYGSDPLRGNFWIVKNSWGPDWGEQGQFRIARGSNMCILESQFAYPSVRKLNGEKCP